MYLDFFDRRTLDVLRRKGEPLTLAGLVRDSEFARSTVIIHLERLGSEGLILKEKKPGKDRGRPEVQYRPQTLLNPERLLSLASLFWSFRGSRRPAGMRKAVTANWQETDA